MKKKRLCLVFSLLLFLSSCSHAQENAEQSLEIEETSPQSFSYAQALGDTAVAYFLGRDFDPAYSLPLYQITPLGDDEKQIPVEGVENLVSIMLYRVAELALDILSPETSFEDYYGFDGERDDVLPEAEYSDTSSEPDVYYNEQGDARAPAGLAYRSILPDIVPLTLSGKMLTAVTTAQLSAAQAHVTLAEVFFPDGNAPDITPKAATGVVTPEFRSWFLSTAQNSGLLDPRLFEADGSWCILALMCGEDYGGSTLRVFDTEIILDESEIGKIREAVATSPIYSMVLGSYVYYDTGDYKAIYISTSAEENIQVTVNFSHSDTHEDYETELERYLSGIHNLTVVLS